MTSFSKYPNTERQIQMLQSPINVSRQEGGAVDGASAGEDRAAAGARLLPRAAHFSFNFWSFLHCRSTRSASGSARTRDRTRRSDGTRTRRRCSLEVRILHIEIQCILTSLAYGRFSTGKLFSIKKWISRSEVQDYHRKERVYAHHQQSRGIFSSRHRSFIAPFQSITTNFKVDDSGMYTCEANGVKCNAQLTVLGKIWGSLLENQADPEGSDTTQNIDSLKLCEL